MGVPEGEEEEEGVVLEEASVSPHEGEVSGEMSLAHTLFSLEEDKTRWCAVL